MKNLSLAVNVILIILVAYLYFAVFSNKKSSAGNNHNATLAVSGDSSSSASERIAYIDLDSLQNRYKYYQKIKGDFEKRQSSANNEIISLQKRFQARAAELQQKAATMSPAEQEKAMAEINKMQSDFQARKDALDKDLFDYNNKMKDDILQKIEDFLKDYNKDRRFSYVFSYEPGFMFYKDSALNITNDVLKGLNTAYDENSK